jgi:hypothetical protein
MSKQTDEPTFIPIEFLSTVPEALWYDLLVEGKT